MASTKKKILIIEDEKPVARALELKLAAAGFAVQSALNGEDGLEWLGKERYALILLDLVLPKMDGFKFCELLKAHNIKTPVFVLTNLSQAEDERRAKALGAKEFFVKSNVSIAEIVERVKRFLE